MNQSRFVAALVAALLASPGVPAFQIGQVRSGSHLGEPLSARVELFGVGPAEATTLALALSPDITLPRGAPGRAAIAAMTARVAIDAAGQPYVLLQSNAPLTQPRLEFRLHASAGEIARTAHLALTLPPAPPERRIRAAASVAAPPAHARGYGPVQAGESLWTILADNDLTGGDVAATIAAVVRANPHAFVDGNADRLRVGVTLKLPPATTATAGTTSISAPSTASLATTRAVPTPGAPPASPARRPLATAQPRREDDPASLAAARAALAEREARIATRLDALGDKMAAIRARYGDPAQNAAPAATTVEHPVSTSAAPLPAPAEHGAAQGPAGDAGQATPSSAKTPSNGGVSRSAPVAEPAAAAVARPASPVVSAPAVGDQEAAGRPGTGRRIGTVVVIAALLAVIGSYGWRRLRHRRVDAPQAAADAQKVAEITRKATRRLELEEDVKRRLSARHGSRRDDAVTMTADPPGD
ncbi:MAG: hypothetical protein RKL32_16100, partial [Gammaproteobacteria bacterium]